MSYVNSQLEGELSQKIEQKRIRLQELSSKMQACGNMLEPAVSRLKEEIKDLHRSLTREKEISEYMEQFCGHRRVKS